MTAPINTQAADIPSLQATPQEIVIQTARDYDISTTTFSNLAFSESGFDPLASSTNPASKACPHGSTDRGIFMINDCYHPEVSDTCAYDVNCAAQFSAGKIVDGELDSWVVCNCYLFVETIVGRLPLAQHIKPNTAPYKGAVAILNFHGIIHYQVVTGFDKTGYFYIGANRESCLIQKGHDEWGDSRLVGFFRPDSS